ncbi:DNA/RNA helicase domain-containing protein [Acrocarpospora pleiomorpha]|uniref:DNA/RNA helicase domain-containing protein n=2 Tax=Acrocarpospora pleiomorpha TaxID=90975 RepID=UPI0031D76B5B
MADLTTRTARMFHTSASTSERESWRASVRHVVNALIEAKLSEVIVILEMSNLSNNGRIDMVLVGSYPGTSDLSLVVVENKQWSWARMDPKNGKVIHPGSLSGTLHPAKQVWSYGESLLRHMSLLHTARMHYLVNLHNAQRKDVVDILPPAEPLPEECDDSLHIFAGDERDEFLSFLTEVLSGDHAADHLRDIDEARVRPNEDLMRAVDRAVRDRPVFVLLDQQRLAVDQIIRDVRQANSARNKKVFIIKGGPGTGKSVLALELLGRLNRLGFATEHASGSSAFAGALREHLSGTRKEVEEVFTYFNQHGRRPENEIDCLVIDEGHRLRATSVDRFTKAEHRTEVPQACELINVARVSVFLLDPYQVIRADEVGTIEEIRQAADDCGVLPTNIHEFTLESQFRHTRCPEFVDWVEQLFGYHGTAPSPCTTFVDRKAAGLLAFGNG